MRSLVANATLAVLLVGSVVGLIVLHELLASIAGVSGRFTASRRWLAGVISVLAVLLAVVIIARFYYLRN